MLYLIVLALSFSLAISIPLEPGQPGGPWTEEEIEIVRAKVILKNLLWSIIGKKAINQVLGIQALLL